MIHPMELTFKDKVDVESKKIVLSFNLCPLQTMPFLGQYVQLGLFRQVSSLNGDIGFLHFYNKM